MKQIKNTMILKILALLLLTLTLTFSVSAQSLVSSAVPSSTPTTIITPNVKVSVPLSFVVQAEKNQDELNLKRELVDSYVKQIAALNSQISGYQKSDAILVAKVDSLTHSLTNAEEQVKLAQANTGLTLQQKQLYEDRLNEVRQELDAARRDLSRANSSKKWWALGGAAVGFGLSKKF